MNYTIANLMAGILFGVVCVIIVLIIVIPLVNFIVFGCDCPYDPEDNPFPQVCNKRIIHTDICEKCPWRSLKEED